MGCPRMSRLAAAAITVAVAGFVLADPQDPVPPPKPDPIAAYEAHKRQGFKVIISRRLPLAAPMLRCLDDRLAELVRVVPPAQLSLLRDVNFWIEAGNDSEPTIPEAHAAAFYVPLDGDYHRAFGMLREKKGGVVILAEAFLIEPLATYYRDAVPGFLLHEVAHALQDRIVGLDQTDAKTAHRLAKERGLYDSVTMRKMKFADTSQIKPGPAYAVTNPIEYFAELSCAYLDLPTNYLPASRDELRKHDDDGYKLMEEFWKSAPTTVVNEFRFPVTIDRVAKTGRRFRLCDLMPGKDKAFDAWPGMTLVATDLLDGTEYQFAAAEGGKWRLRPKQESVTTPAVAPSRTTGPPPAPATPGTPSA
jgi:hypothetical protein